MDGMLSPADVAVLSGNTGTNRNNDGYGFGGDGAWWIILFLIFGWGRNGFGGNGFGGGNGCGANTTCATPADVYNAVDQQTLISKLDQQTYGLADSTFALNNTITNGFFGVQNALCQGFSGINQAINTNGYETRLASQGLSSQLASCCCDIERQIADCCCKVERGIDGVNYNNAMQTNMLQQTMCNNTRDILESNNNNTRAILDFLTQDKISTLQSENQALKFQASQSAQNAFITANQDAQTAELIRRLGADCPTPAYIVPNPNCCYNYAVTGFGYGNSGCCNNTF